MLRSLLSRNVVEAGTAEAVAEVSMEEAEVAFTEAVEAADSMEVVAEVFTAEAAEHIAAVVACTAAVRPVARLAVWVPMDAAVACTAADVRLARTAECVRTA